MSKAKQAPTYVLYVENDKPQAMMFKQRAKADAFARVMRAQKSPYVDVMSAKEFVLINKFVAPIVLTADAA